VTHETDPSTWTWPEITSHPAFGDAAQTVARRLAYQIAGDPRDPEAMMRFLEASRDLALRITPEDADTATVWFAGRRFTITRESFFTNRFSAVETMDLIYADSAADLHSR